MMDTFSYQCPNHRANPISNVEKCQITSENGVLYHCVFFKQPIDPFVPIRQNTCRVENDRKTLYETMMSRSLCSIADLANSISVEFLNSIIIDILQYFAILKRHRVIVKIPGTKKEKKNFGQLFCTNIINVTVDGKLVFLFRHLNSQKNNTEKALRKQSFNVIAIVRELLFRSDGTPLNNPCCTNCKLIKLKYFFSNLNYDPLHTIFCGNKTKGVLFQDFLHHFCAHHTDLISSLAH